MYQNRSHIASSVANCRYTSIKPKSTCFLPAVRITRSKIDLSRWLGEFLDQSRSSDTPVHATYVVSGEALPTPAKSLIGSNEDEEFENSQASSSSSAITSVPTWQMVLAPEQDLERECYLALIVRATTHIYVLMCHLECKGRFVRVASINVYSLSPASLKVKTVTTYRLL